MEHGQRFTLLPFVSFRLASFVGADMLSCILAYKNMENSAAAASSSGHLQILLPRLDIL